jgi:hypothetical protein
MVSSQSQGLGMTCGLHLPSRRGAGETGCLPDNLACGPMGQAIADPRGQEKRRGYEGA